MVTSRAVSATAERVVAADPTKVWALVADPSRLAEWAGVVTVGYMGTELPSAGHHVFVKRRRWGRKTRRIDVETWDAGTAIVCGIHTDAQPIRFEVHVSPEVEPDRIATRVRLTQTVHIRQPLSAVALWATGRLLARKLDRIERATGV